MGPLVDHAPALEHDHPIRAFEHADAVGNDENGPGLGERMDPLYEDPFRVVVDRGQHVVEDEQLAGPEDRAGEGHALLLAAGEGDPALADDGPQPGRQALEIGADINQTDHGGTAPLHVAAQRNYATVVQLLADHGADLNLKNGNGTTPLKLAERAEARRLERPDVTTNPSGNSAQVLRDLGATDDPEEAKATEESQPQ